MKDVEKKTILRNGTKVSVVKYPEDENWSLKEKSNED